MVMPTKYREMHKAKDRKADVAADMARLKGKSRQDLERDDRRGAASPLGHGLGSKKMEEKGR
jgi:hypothetical protein